MKITFVVVIPYIQDSERRVDVQNICLAAESQTSSRLLNRSTTIFKQCSTLVIFPHIKQDVVSYGITRYVELTTVWGASVRFRSVIRHTLLLIISIHARCWRSGGDAMMGTLSLTVSTFSTVSRSLLRSFYKPGTNTDH